MTWSILSGSILTSWVRVNAPVIAEGMAPKEDGELGSNISSSDYTVSDANSYSHLLDARPKEMK